MAILWQVRQHIYPEQTRCLTKLAQRKARLHQTGGEMRHSVIRYHMLLQR